MTEDTSSPLQTEDRAKLVLGVDTCGPSGSVALARLDADGRVETIEQMELAGKTYSATLVSAVAGLLGRIGAKTADLQAIVVTSGPGSFTGVRVGLSAVKGLAEPRALPVVAVSRLAVLAQKAGTKAAALDAHRHEIFLRLSGDGVESREFLAGAAELEAAPSAPYRIAICDDAAAELLSAAWPHAELVRVLPPTAADAIALATPKITAQEFVNLALLDGHYLRRSDAEIFGDPAQTAARRA